MPHLPNVQFMERYKKKPGRFKKGDPRFKNNGRKVGVPNRIPQLFRECIEIATANVGKPEPIYAPKMKKGEVVRRNGKPVLTELIIGWKGTGKDGVVGYLEWLALNAPTSFAGLIARTMPLQVHTSSKVDVSVSSRFKDLDTTKMNMAELMVAFREAVSLTQPRAAAPKLIEHRANEYASVKDAV